MNKELRPGLSIIVMAHERQEETLRAIDALSRVDFGCDTEIIVSDNPSTPDKRITDLPGNVIHKVRIPSGDSLWHANKIFEEIDREWTLLTHDDDEILPCLGKLFSKYSANSEIMMISGKSRIIKDGVVITDEKYLGRLESAGLLNKSESIRKDLFDALFDYGPLFPASAMITRSSHLLKFSNINPDYDLAGDLAHSMSLAHDAHVLFEGDEFVMNYHIHGGNSVFSPQAAGGLMADFSIVKLNEAINHNIELNADRRRMLIKSVLIARILSKSFHLDERYESVNRYLAKFNRHFSQNAIPRLIAVPLPLGPIKIVVRKLMWKKLGLNKWGYR